MERFTGNGYWPNYNRGSGQTEVIQSKLPVFAFDVHSSGAKNFFGFGYEGLLDYYRTKIEQSHTNVNMYEVLQYHIPSKMYFDLESTEIGYEEFSELVSEFLNFCIEKLSKIFDYQFSDNNVTVLNASTQIKRSYHVIFQYFFEDIQTIKMLITLFVDEFPNPKIKEIVDFSVYSRNRPFRLLYSTKLGKTNKFVINGKSDAYNAMDVFDCLIQAKLPPHYTGILNTSRFKDIHGKVFKYSTTSSKLQVFRGKNIDKTNLPPRLEEYIKLVGDGEIRSCKQVNEFIYCIVANMRCPHVKRVHKHNNQFFTFNTESLISWFKCSDPDCPEKIYKKDYIGWILVEKNNT
jgi:hypothetical protein